MKWLLILYPPAWQRRYRQEVDAHLEAEPKRFRTALDLVAGAVDAWLNPEWIPAATTTAGEQTMITASRQRPIDITVAAAQRSGAWMLGISFGLVALGVALDKTLGDHMLIKALIYSSFFIAVTVSTRHTFLQPYSRAARNVIIGTTSLAWYALFVAILAIGAR